jgi:hypothetical protein
MAVNEHDGDEKDALLSRLYREAAREEPPAHLDRAITAAARESVGRRSSPAYSRSRSWWTPWRLPFAFAALAVVSVSLVTLMIEEDAERVASVPASSPPAAQEREAAKIAQPPAEAAASNAAPGKPEQPRRAQRQDARKPEPEFVPEPPPTSATRGELARAEAPAEAGPRALQKAPGSEAAPPPAQDALAAGAVGARSEVQSRRSEERAAAAPAPAPAAEAAQAPLGDARAPAARPAPQPAVKPAPAPKGTIGIRGMERDGYATQARPSPEVARHIVELEGKPPSAWIERVLTLRREARMAEADGLLAEFRRRFPGELLPPELQ